MVEAIIPSAKLKDNDKWLNSGFGLYMVCEICKYLGDDFCIVSYGNYLLIDANGIHSGETLYKGTAIKIRRPYNNKMIKSPKVPSSRYFW